MKVLLIKPPLNPGLSQVTYTLYEPLELEYIAATVDEHDVDIFDMRIEKNLIKKLRTFKPDVVGITAYTCDVKIVKKILKEVKLHDRNIKTVIGGHHATFMPRDFIDPCIDIVFIGYADKNFKDYINILTNGGDIKSINNVGIIEDKRIFFTEQKPVSMDLDSLPLPARNLTQKYSRKYHDSLRNKLALIMTSRGCPFRCNFCACWKLMDGKYATRSVDSVINELKNLPDFVDLVYFSDDNTLQNIKRAWKLSRMLKEHKIKRKFLMYARTDTIVNHPDLLGNLKEAGLEYLTVGIESFSDEKLNKLNKKTSVKINNEAIRILKKLDIYINAHFLVEPEFTVEDFEQLFQYVSDKQLFRPVFPVITPFPGTDLYNESSQDIAVQDYDFFDGAHSVFPTKLTRKDFYNQLVDLYKKSYSMKRYFKYRKTRLQKSLEDSPDFYAFNSDGITLFKLFLVQIFAVFKSYKYRNIYKSEPLKKELAEEQVI